MKSWKIKPGAPVWHHNKVYYPGDIIQSEARPVLDHHLDERVWEQHLEEVPDRYGSRTEPHRQPTKPVAKKPLKAVK